jgi:hypothetical protein
MTGHDELLPFLTPIPSLMDGEGKEWDTRDPLDLLSRQERDQLRADLDEIAACQRRAMAAAHSYWLH